MKDSRIFNERLATLKQKSILLEAALPGTMTYLPNPLRKGNLKACHWLFWGLLCLCYFGTDQHEAVPLLRFN